MAEENDVTANKLAEENQVTKKEPQRVTTKNPKKVEAGKRLAKSNHKKREAKKREEQAKLEANYSSGSDRSWLLHLSNKESRATSIIKPTTK